MSPITQPLNPLQALDQYRFLMILHAAHECEEYQFAKQASTLWIVNYPGDLFVKYHQAMAYANLDQKNQAVSVFEELVELDPLFLEPNRALSQFASSSAYRAFYADVCQYLEQKSRPDKAAEKWLFPLWDARLSYNQGDLEKATALIHETLVHNPLSPIPAVLHLQTAYKLNNQDMLNNLSEIYYQQWPKCLQINVIKALVEIELGLESQAVERLHWVAAHDSAGQVIQKMMGIGHRFQSLWPERFEIHFDLPIPASVTAFLGWNQLQTGPQEAPIFKQTSELKPLIHDDFAVQQNDVTREIRLTSTPKKPPKNQIQPHQQDQPDKSENVSYASQEDFEEIQQVFSRIAKRIKKPDLERADNRFPVYVLMTSKKQLEKVYGPNTTAVIDELLNELVNLIQRLPDWGAKLFYPDDPELVSQMGIKPVFGFDPWQIKLALADLDAALAKQGEMIGSLLIVGGPEIVPFHHLPNPTYDDDLDVPSDNPYGSIDENYFIPQWPVGRLPGESGNDAGLLLQQIREMIYQYKKRSKHAKSIVVNVAAMINWILKFFSNLRNDLNHKEDLGYSAEIWQRTSAEVYKVVGNVRDLQLSPPIYANNLAFNSQPRLQVGYFNLHGVKDGPYWYGQKDFSSESNEPDYPIALSPDMFNESHPSPKLVLTEACYGAHIAEKRNDDALSLKCLDNGTESFIGSTCIAYGSITPPLTAADFLAETFWRKSLEGLPAGYALMQAKLSLAEEMTKNQGFLDGEDQKTLLSFVLYGDPLAVHDGLQTMPKPLFRFKSYPSVRTLSDSDMLATNDSSEFPKQVDKQIKKVIDKYLPGLENAQLQYKKSASSFGSVTGSAGKTTGSISSERYVVTLQKTFDQNQHTVHRHYARITFDKKGKLLKFTTSR